MYKTKFLLAQLILVLTTSIAAYLFLNPVTTILPLFAIVQLTT